jgi:putative hydrolase of the HAD superfamily
MPLHAVLWDVDDTLFDYCGANADGALRHFAADGTLSRYPSEEAALEHWWAVMEVHYGRFLAGELSFTGQRRERARAFLGRPLTDAEADRWFAGYTACFEAAWRLFPDVVPALDALAASHRHAVLSNSSEAYQRRKLRRLGIGDRFETVLCSDDLGHAKPAPEAFHAACRALGLPPHAVAYVGDRSDTDAVAATEAGLRGIWLDRAGAAGPGGDGPPRVTTLAGLPALLASVGPAPGPDARPDAGREQDRVSDSRTSG